MGTLRAAGLVEHFAVLSARLDDAFADRAALLATAGLNEPAFRGLQEGWLALFRAPEGEVLAKRFGRAYAAAQARIHLPDAEADETLELKVFPDRPTLPFGPANEDESGVRPTERLPQPGASRPAPREPLDETECTLALPTYLANQPGRPALPFARPGKRLANFDPDTGRPLAVPTWIDDPAPRKPSSTT